MSTSTIYHTWAMLTCSQTSATHIPSSWNVPDIHWNHNTFFLYACACVCSCVVHVHKLDAGHNWTWPEQCLCYDPSSCRHSAMIVTLDMPFAWGSKYERPMYPLYAVMWSDAWDTMLCNVAQTLWNLCHLGGNRSHVSYSVTIATKLFQIPYLGILQ